MEEPIIKVTPDKEKAAELFAALRENGGYCPCAIQKTEDTKCMCREFREMAEGTCHCGLYIKVDDKPAGTTKKYDFCFVGYNKAGERIVEDIRSDAPDDVEVFAVKEQFAMALEMEHECPFRCVGIREVEE